MLGRKQNERLLTLQSTRSQMFLSLSRSLLIRTHVCMYVYTQVDALESYLLFPLETYE